jgi:hypothetical protein
VNILPVSSRINDSSCEKLFIGKSVRNVDVPVRERTMESINPFTDSSLIFIDFLPTANEASNDAPIWVTVDTRKQKLWFRLIEVRSTFFLPSTLHPISPFRAFQDENLFLLGLLLTFRDGLCRKMVRLRRCLTLVEAQGQPAVVSRLRWMPSIGTSKSHPRVAGYGLESAVIQPAGQFQQTLFCGQTAVFHTSIMHCDNNALERQVRWPAVILWLFRGCAP